ncbi:MAG TPA: hypothetical protein VKB88_35825, partial [Bryobacteraceae bacterium]|nr:hypothetical protein [Bryobacteraceae bacterium]
MTDSREDLAGVCLAEEYTLRRYLVSEDSGDFFEGARATGEPVLIKLEPDGAAADDRVALWRRTAYLQHPNLLRMLDCGRSAQGIYAVMESPDDHLSTGLQQGPLAELEARDLLLALLDALRYLHAQGLVHGQVDANHVWAVADSIKLSTDNLREPVAGESPYGGDIGAVGSLLYLALTGQPFEGRVHDVSEPFATIVRNTAGAQTADRWRIPEILAALPPLPKRPAAAPEPTPVVVVADPPAPV